MRCFSFSRLNDVRAANKKCLVQVPPFLPDPGGRPRKGFVGWSVGRSVTFSYPAMINTLPFGQKFSHLVHTSGTLREVTEPNITSIGQMVAL